MTNLQKLIDCWRPIEEAPKDGTFVLAYPCFGTSMQPYLINWQNRKISSDWFFGGTRVTAQPAHYMPLDTPEKLAKIVGLLVDAINKTLDDNGHLADGDVCTLIDLKRGLQQAEKIAG